MENRIGKPCSLSELTTGKNQIFFANVRDHRYLPVARLLLGEERTQAGGVTRVGIRWIALFGLFSFLSDDACVGNIFGVNLRFLKFRKRHRSWRFVFQSELDRKWLDQCEIPASYRKIYSPRSGLRCNGSEGSHARSDLVELPWT
jgi:hypothetical protein